MGRDLIDHPRIRIDPADAPFVTSEIYPLNDAGTRAATDRVRSWSWRIRPCHRCLPPPGQGGGQVGGRSSRSAFTLASSTVPQHPGRPAERATHKGPGGVKALWVGRSVLWGRSAPRLLPTSKPLQATANPRQT